MLPLAVDSSESSEISLEDLIKFKKKHGIDDVNINFTFLVGFILPKNVLNLIKAFSKLVSLFPSIRLFVVGDDQGSYHECINYVKENNLEDFFHIYWTNICKREVENVFVFFMLCNFP